MTISLVIKGRLGAGHRPLRRKPALVTVLAFLQLLPSGCISSLPEEQLDELSDNFTGSVQFSTDQSTPFTLQGTQEHLGDFTARGEVNFRPGQTPGSLIGEGVAVFTTASGDNLVGIVIWEADAEDSSGNRASDIRFSWRDSVQLGDGTVLASTGEFADASNRPPGLVVIAIIAVLVSLLVPSPRK